ncbi:MAG TPA: DinB family protein [Vicinamibacteria bacterium]|nr:DinB family protein [Vicinamibacteria bacterium]
MPKSDDRQLRDHLLRLLDGREAHASLEDVLRDVPPRIRGKKPDGAPHTPWQLLEHMRLAQWDILEFSRSAAHVSPRFPEGYWPETAEPPEDGAWEKSVASFRSDLEEMKALVGRESADLHAPIPHGSGQTLLREALLVADHSAYHLGQIVLLRKMMAAWEGDTKIDGLG